MTASPPTLIDTLKACRIYWSAWSGVEAALAIRICRTYCDGRWDKMAQMLCAYMYIAGKRDNGKMTASVIDAEVAKNIPRIRRAKEGAANRDCIGADAYRKGVKRDLRDCGLLDFECERPRTASQLPTVYTFPAFEKELSRRAGSDREGGTGSRDSSAGAYSATSGTTGTFNPGHAEQVQGITPAASEQPPGFTPTSIDTEATGNIGGTESGNNLNDIFLLKSSSVKCPSCSSHDVQVVDPEHWTCRNCTYRFDADGYAW